MNAMPKLFTYSVDAPMGMKEDFFGFMYGSFVSLSVLICMLNKYIILFVCHGAILTLF